MGGSQSSSQESSSSSSSTSRTFESPLSQEQLGILQERRAQYNSWYYPEMQSAVAATNSDSKETAATMANQAGKINSAYTAGSQALNQNLGQQGLLGEGSGVQAALKQAQERSRSSSLAQAYYNTLSSNADKKATLLGIGSSMMPTATTSAQYLQETSSKSSGTGSGSSSGWNVGL